MNAAQKRLQVRENRKNGNIKELSIGDVASGVLNGIGAASDYVDKSVGIAGTPVNIYNARKGLKNLALNATGQKDNKWADLGLEFLIPDSSDLLGGAGYASRGTDLLQALRIAKKTPKSSIKIAKAAGEDLKQVTRELTDGKPLAFETIAAGLAKNGKNGKNGEKLVNDDLFEQLSKPLRAQLLPKIQRTFTPRGLGARGVVGDAQGRKVETLLARNNITHLKNRDKNSLIATNWNLSDQAAYQKRYLSSREVKAQAHHMHDHELWGKAKDRPDGDKIEKILVKNGIRKGNDEVNMTDAWGWEKERNIFGKDHGYLHDMYNKVPERKEVLDMIENGSWNRMSPKYAANRLIAVAKQNEKITVNWAHWKLGEIYKNHPHTKLFPPKQMRKWIELNPEEAARAGSAAQMPSFEKISGPKKHTNEMLRTVFGLKYGHKTLAKINP